jgi:hypothetical protein
MPASMPAVREVATAASPEKEKQPAASVCYGNVIEYIQGIDVFSCRQEAS